MGSPQSGVGARHRRQKRLATASLLANCQLYPQLDWDDLLAFPDWCLFAEAEKQSFVRVCGALLLMPSIRLWIDGRKINQIRELLGEPVFDKVLHTELDLATNYLDSIIMADAEELLIKAGATVVINDANAIAVDYIKTVVGSMSAVIPKLTAHQIVNQAYHIFYDLKCVHFPGQMPEPESDQLNELES